MADDKVMIPLGLDIDFDAIEKQWNAKKGELEKMMSLDVKLNFSKLNTDSLKSVQEELKKIKLQPITPETKDAIKSLVTELRTLETLLKRIDSLNLKNGKDVQKAQRDAANTTKALSNAKLAEMKVQSESQAQMARGQKLYQQQAMVEQQLAAAKLRVQAAEQRLNGTRAASTGIIQTQTNALISQNMALNGVKQLATQYLSILGAWRLFENIRKTTADFELQRVALRAIIQDAKEADKIFGQTLNLALESPFTAQELIGYTKQLAAYRLETDKLHETTKRLADVSAGLGVDMGRLILAYGQVRAASVLRGQEIRQFTEAGVPLVELLAEKFTELKNRVVDTSEVFDLVSKRQVPFEMVSEIFEDMTDKGGIFYDMQKIQSETLYGIYRKLGDNISQAFNRIGESNMGVFKGIGNILIELARNLETVGNVLLTGVSVWALYKTGMVANAKILGGYNSQLITSTMLEKKKSAELLIQASSYRMLTTAELHTIATQGQLTVSDIAAMNTSKQVRTELTLRLIALGKLSAAEQARAVQLGLVTQAEVNYALGMTRMQKMSLLFGGAVRGLTASLKALFVTLLKNPLTWIAAAFGLVMSAINKTKERNEALQKSIKASNDEMSTFYEKVKKAYAGAQDVINKGLSSDSTDKQIKAATEAFDALLDSNRELEPIIERRIKNISDERLRLLELKKVWDEINEAASNQAQPELFSSAINKEFTNYQRKGFLGLGGVAQPDDSYIDMVERLDKGLIKVSKTLQGMPKTDAIKQANSDFVTLVGQLRAGTLQVDDFGKQLHTVFANLPTDSKASDELMELQKTAQATMSIAIKARNEITSNLRMFDGAFPDYTSDGGDTLGLSEKGFTEYQVWVQKQISALDGQLAESDGDIAGMVQAWLNRSLKVAVKDSSKTTETDFKLWRDGLSKIMRTVMDNGEAVLKPLFITAEIGDFKSLEDAIKRVTDDYNDLIEQKRNWDNLAQSKVASQAVIDDAIEQSAALALLMQSYEEAAKYLNMLIELKKKNKTTGSDKRPSELQAEISAVKEAYKRYEELRKIMSDTSAQELIKRENEALFKSFKRLFNQKPGDIMPAFSPDELIKILNTGLTRGQAYLDHKGKLQIRADIADTTFDDIEKTMKEELARINNEISRQQSTNSFYEKLLGMTGDAKLSSEWTVSTTGLDMLDTRVKLVESLQKAFTDLATGEQIDISAMFTEGGGLDISKIQAEIDKLPEKTRANAQSALDALIKYEQDVVTSLYQTLGKFDSYEARREAARKKAAADIAKMMGTDASDETKADYATARKRQEGKEIATIDLEEIKNMDDFIKAFEDLDKVGTTTMEDLRAVLVRFLEVSKESLDPTQIRELVKQIEKLDEAMQARNPWRTFIDGMKEWKDASGILAEAQTALADAEARQADAYNRATQAQEEVEEAGDPTERAAALERLADASEDYANASKDVKTTREGVKEAEDGVARAQNKTLTGIQKTQQKWNQMAGLMNDTVGILTDVADGLGIALGDDAETAVQAFSKALGIVSAAFGIITTAIMFADAAGKSLMATLWPLLVVAIALSAAFIIFGSKQRRLNKEIEESELRVKKLENAYKDLERQMEQTAGTKKWENYKGMIENLYRQSLEYQRQARAENDKGKDKDKSKIEDLKQAAIEAIQEVENLMIEFKEETLGGTFTDFAEQLGNAMFDALADGKNVAIQAWDEAVDEIIANMVRKFLITKFLEEPIQKMLDEFWGSAQTIDQIPAWTQQKVDIEKALERLRWIQKMGFTQFDAQIKEYEANLAYLNKAIDAAADAGVNMNGENVGKLQEGLSNLGEDFWSWINASGLSDYFGGSGESNLTGISKSVGQLTEDTALTLAAVANSVLWYQIGSYNLLFNMNDILTRWDVMMTEMGANGVGLIPSLIAYQTSAMALMQAIKDDTGRIAAASEQLAGDVRSVISPLGVRASAQAFNVNS